MSKKARERDMIQTGALALAISTLRRASTRTRNGVQHKAFFISRSIISKKKGRKGVHERICASTRALTQFNGEKRRSKEMNMWAS